MDVYNEGNETYISPSWCLLVINITTRNAWLITLNNETKKCLFS